jgi:Domain of unknown function (DUF1833)
MPNSTLTQALKEAYASAPAGVVVYHTLELRHPAFSAPIRVVRDYQNLTATLEASAPADPLTSVTFVAFSFDFTLPEVSPAGLPQVRIEMDNVDRVIVANIEAALATTSLVQCTYREFISTDLGAPQNNPALHMTIMSINADIFRVRAVAGFPNLMNVRFPRIEYDAQTFPGLVL